MSAQFPNVPNVPGVPALLRQVAGDVLEQIQISLLTADGPGATTNADRPPWGVYQNGFPVVAADSCVSLDYRKEWRVSDYQIEGGGFEDYDKVEEPYEVTVRLSAGGSQARRETFLRTLQEIAGNLQLYDVVMPEWTYISANITGLDYRRSNDQGLGLMQVDVRLQEIRMTGEAVFTTTKQPDGATQKNDGTVATAPAKPQQQSVLSAAGL